MNTQALAVQPQSSAINLFDPTQFESMQRLCKMYANSDLVPESYRVSDKKAESKAMANCMIAVSMAQRMNADHLMVMQNLDIIQGKPSWSSKFLIAIVNSCGKFERLEFEWTDLGELRDVQFTDYDWQNGRKIPVTKVVKGPVRNLKCVAHTRQKGSDKKMESTPVTMEMAIKEGWYTKAGSKWQTMPEQMLQYRAASFWQKVHAPELSLGLQTQEEARDIVDVEYTEVLDASSKLKEELIKANAEEFIPAAESSATPDPGQSPNQPDPVISDTSDNKPPFM